MPRELKHLINMCFHFPLNLVWFTCIPSRFLLMMTFSIIPMSSSHHLTFGMCLFWTMVLHPLFFRKSNKKLMILCSRPPCLMNFEIFTNEWYSTWMFSCFSSPTKTVEYILHAHLHQRNPAEEDWKSLMPYFGCKSEQVIQNTYKVTSRFGGTVPQNDYLKEHFKSRNPVFNIPRRKEQFLLIQSLVTHQPSMMEVPWPSSLLERAL